MYVCMRHVCICMCVFVLFEYCIYNSLYAHDLKCVCTVCMYVCMYVSMYVCDLFFVNQVHDWYGS